MKYLRSALLLALLMPAVPAEASGGLWCNVDDANIKLDIEAGVTRGMGYPLFNLKATAELKDPDVMPEFRKLELSDKLVHSWVYGETKLYFYTEIDQGGSIYSADLVIDTKPGEDEGDYAGTYTVSVSNPGAASADGRIESSGPITCGGE